METIKILKENKETLVEKTLNIIGDAIASNRGMFIANLAFYYVINENNELEVNYHPYVGNVSHSDSVFFVINSSDMPDTHDLGIEDIPEARDVDFAALGYDEYISDYIENIINLHD